MLGCSFSIMTAIPALVMLRNPMVLSDPTSITISLTVVGMCISAAASQLVMSQIASEFTENFEESSTLSSSQVPPFRSVETVVFLAGYIGDAMAMIIVVAMQMIYRPDAISGWSNLFTVLAV